jgi:molybdopterin adenylyltransferase
MRAGAGQKRGAPDLWADGDGDRDMAKIDEQRPFVPVRIAVLTVSDTRSARDDKSGDSLAQMIRAAGHAVADRAIVPDDVASIEARVKAWIADPDIDVVITTGGTGFTGRDVTPEAIRPLFEKEIDGFSTVFHMISFQKVATSTIQSRACAGLAHGTYIFCLPGSPGACKDAWEGILRHQLDNRHRPCNLVEIMPRLEEHRAR